MIKIDTFINISNQVIIIMMKRLLLLAGMIWLMCAAAVAADIKCSGVVVDDQGEPIIGATVSVPGTNIAAATDIDGRFALNVPDGKKIHISYIGYKPVDLAAKADMGDIQLEVEAQMLKDVVVEQSAARTRLTPVAVSTIGAQTIDLKLNVAHIGFGSEVDRLIAYI